MFGKGKQKSKKKNVDLKVNDSSNLPSTRSSDRLAELEAEMELKNLNQANPEQFERTTKLEKSTLKTFCLILLLTVVLAKLPFSQLLFTPLNQFSTMIHELSHAIACILTGGWVSGMTIVADGHGHGGLTFCHGGIPFVYYQAGYIGTAVFGCLLVFLGQYKHLAKPTLTTVGILAALGSLIFMGAGLISPLFVQVSMSLLWAAALSFILIWAGIKLDEKKANLVLMFLAINTSLDSLSAIGIVISNLIFSTGIKSDATAMQSVYLLPAIFWSLFWAVSSICLIGFTVWYSFGKPRR